MTCAIGPLQSFGLVFGEYLREIGDEAGVTTMVHSIFGICCSLVGIFVSPLFRHHSLRTVGLGGCCIYVSGTIMCVFVNSVPLLVLGYAVLQGIGFGLMVPVVFTSLNNYFEVKRSMMTSIAQTGASVGSIVMPFILKSCMDNFGFRGTLLITVGISLNLIFAMLVMHPVRWYMKGSPLPDKEMHLVITKEADSDIHDISNESEKNIENGYLEQEKLITDHSQKLDENEYISEDVLVKNVKTSALNLNNISPSLLDLRPIANDPKKESMMKNIIASLDLSLLKDPVYINMAFGLSFTFGADIMLIGLTPFIVNNRGVSGDRIALILTIAATSDLASRTLMSIFSTCVSVKSRYVIFTGSFLACVFRTVIAHSTDFITLCFVFALIGVVRSWIQVPAPLIFAEQYHQDRFPAAWGLYMVIQGIVNILIGLLLGSVAKITDNDFWIMHSLTFTTALCVFPWVIEFLFCSKKEEKKV